MAVSWANMPKIRLVAAGARPTPVSVTVSIRDSAFAFACNSYNRRTVAAGAEVRFLAPTRLGDVLRYELAELWQRDRATLVPERHARYQRIGQVTGG